MKINHVKKNLKIVELESGDKMKIYYNTWLSFCVRLVNKIFKQDFIATVQPLSMNLHIHDKKYFDNLPMRLVTHEFIHILQCKVKTRVWFLLKYVWYSMRYGYWKNPFEVQAYKYENEGIKDVLALKDEIKKL